MDQESHVSSPHHIRTFLVVVDDSQEMQTALHYACTRARSTHGRVALLRITPPVERQHFIAITELMEQEAHDAAEVLLQKLATTVNDLSGQLPSVAIRNGHAEEEILAFLEENPSISILVLAAGTGADGPGPLVTALTGRLVNRLRVPITIVPGTLTYSHVEACAQ